MKFIFSRKRRHTRYWRDWISDVCSSDLTQRRRAAPASIPRHVSVLVTGSGAAREIGRASCREGVWLSVVALSFQIMSSDPTLEHNYHTIAAPVTYIDTTYLLMLLNYNSS